jgi:DNA/RNA endonuclease YhcR with UshA esterase domain
VVREDRTPYEGLRILTLRDISGEIDVTLPVSTTAMGGALPEVTVGQTVQAVGAVDQYKGTPQVSVGRGGDLLVLDESMTIAPERRIGELSAGDVGSLCAVQGVVSNVSTFSAGVKCVLDDGSGTATLLLWQDLYDSLPEREALAQGAMVRVQGEVSEYRGELEIVPELPSDVAVLAATQRIVAERQVGKLSMEDVGQMVQVEGVLTSLRTFAAGVRGTLDDGTGAVTLLLWQDVYDGRPDPAALAPGTVLRVEGEVAEYKGELELVPQAAGDVVVVGTVELPSEEWAIGQLSADDVGQTVQIAGRITQVSPFSQGVKYSLDDGTGIITLLLWQDLYSQLDNAVALAEEAWVSVRGEIDEYQGKLEIIPQVPADVSVTRSGQVAQVTATPVPNPSEGITPEATAALTETPQPTATAEPTATPTPAPQPTLAPTTRPTPATETRTIGAVSSSDVGSTLRIAKAWLSDGTGEILIYVPERAVEYLPAGIGPGTRLRVTGEVDVYKGEIEIIPLAGADIEVQ